MLAFDLILFDELLAIHHHLVVVVSDGGGQDQIPSCLVGLVGGGVADAVRSLFSGASPVGHVIGNGPFLCRFGCAAEVVAGAVGFLLDRTVPDCSPEDIARSPEVRASRARALRDQQVADAGDDADGIEGRGLGRSAAAGDRRPRIGAEDGDGLDLGTVERQNVVFILEQRDALERALQGDGPVGDGIGGVGRDRIAGDR